MKAVISIPRPRRTVIVVRTNGSFRKLGVPYFGVLIIRILLFRVLYRGPLFSETPKSSISAKTTIPGLGLPAILLYSTTTYHTTIY